jgi:hypothetical protein
MTHTLQVHVRKNSRRLGLDLSALRPPGPALYLGRLGLFRVPLDQSARAAFWARLPQRFEAFVDRFPVVDLKPDDLRAVIATVSEHVGPPTETEAAKVMDALSTPSEQRKLAREIRAQEARLEALKHELSATAR